MIRPVTCAIIAAMLLPVPAHAQAAPDARAAVIGAATALSMGYGVWLMEKRCQTLSPEKRKAFDAVVMDDLNRLQAAADEKLFNATVGAGRDLSNDPKYADCKEFATGGLVDFGLDQARDAAGKLASLPPGFHLTITD